MNTHSPVAEMDSGDLTRLAALAAEAAGLARQFDGFPGMPGSAERQYVALAAECSVELWRRRREAASRCGTLAPYDVRMNA